MLQGGLQLLTLLLLLLWLSHGGIKLLLLLLLLLWLNHWGIKLLLLLLSSSVLVHCQNKHLAIGTAFTGATDVVLGAIVGVHWGCLNQIPRSMAELRIR